MENLRFHCLDCGGRLSIDGEAVGLEVACPHCGGATVVPQSGEVHTGTPPSTPVGELISIDVRFLCPCCGKRLATDSSHAGARAECPECKQEILVPLPPRMIHMQMLTAEEELSSAMPGRVPATVLTDEEIAFFLAP